jgi:hypothetical protein
MWQKMNEDNKDFDLSRYADAVDQEKLSELWAKVEVAKIMMDQANKLTRQVYADLEFYQMTSEFKKSDSDGD